MIGKNTILMVGGGLLAGYGASQIGGKNSLSKLEVIGPIIAGLGLLYYGYTNYKKPQPQLPGIKESLENRPNNTTPPITLSRSSNAQSTNARVWSNYTSYGTLNASGNASPQYDYNHIYPGFI